MINFILDQEPYDNCNDYNNDGLLNIIDIVQLINFILNQ